MRIIAEIGWNHMGDMSIAKEMILAAKKSGADYCKFQTWSEKFLKKGAWDKDGRREIYKKAELSHDQHRELKDFCIKNLTIVLLKILSQYSHSKACTKKIILNPNFCKTSAGNINR